MWLDDDQLACETWHRQGDFGVSETSETNEIEVLTKYYGQVLKFFEELGEGENKKAEERRKAEERKKEERAL